LIYELFDHLKEIYDELNKNQKSRREYNTLKQADKSFNVFYFNFMKLFSYLDYDDVTILACVTRKMLGKEMLGHLDDVEQYYR